MPNVTPSFPSSLSSPLPDISANTALFLDFDGTLVDIASQPEDVQVPADMVSMLRGLSAHLGGALAIVSGRKLSELDAFLRPLQLPSAAEHGSQQRWPDGEVIRLASPDLRRVGQMASEFAATHAGVRVEVKPAAVALHYRHAPERETACLQLMLDASRMATGVELLRGKFVFELKPAGISKGTAIEAFMTSPSFLGKVPLFAGDDVTDEAGFAVMQHLGGYGIKVGEGASLARYRCPSPASLRAWLATACASLDALMPDSGRHPSLPVVAPSVPSPPVPSTSLHLAQGKP